MKESKFIRYMITGVVCAFFLMCELTLIKYCKTSMFFMRGEVIKLSLIAGIILIPFEKIGYSLYCERILVFRKDFGIFGRKIALAMSVLIGSLIIIGKEVNDPDIYCILIPILTICWIIAMVVCDVSEEEKPIYLFVVAAIQYFADEILLMVFTFIGALYLKVKDFHYIEVTDNNILIGTSTIGLMSRHTWSLIVYILLALSIVLLSVFSYITFRKNEKYIRAQIVFTAGIGFILMFLYDIFINTRGYIFDYTTDNVMIRNGVISCMLARGMMMLFAFIVLRIQYNSEPELSKIVIYDEIDFATQIYDEKAELLKKEYTNRIRLYRKSVENILKEKEKTEEEKE